MLLYLASFSIPLNIAEASGRFSNPDRRNFYVIARSSVFECVAILDILHDQQFISDSQFNDYLEKSENLSKILFALIKKYS
ncbi:MAG: four helix bundle protein [Saprospiraceae bacterium]|nr:four helix bundle protein [Saprospiraceae bacterium]